MGSRHGMGKRKGRCNGESDGGMSNGWREGWVIEDAVMRQRRTKVEGEEHGERDYDDIPRERRLIELVAPPPSPPALFPPSLTPSHPISLMHALYILEPD